MRSIFEYRNNLIDDFSRFSQSFVNPKAEDISKYLKDSELKGNFWPEPLLQINPHYKNGETVSKLVSSNILDPECEKIFKKKNSDDPIRFYIHQAQAITAAGRHENYILTTGTGSGKSLSFFVPIVSRILKEKRTDNTPRTRAIIIYPMNALANSQIDEINGFLSNDPDCNVTVGRYTGQESREERIKIAKNPPDILLTNYMMMELILTRYEDIDINVIEHAKNLEFLVLDELHTYRGRQGADVALLIRRLRYRLNATNMICIGTSATMTSIGSDSDQRKAVAETASVIFGTEFKPENVITETLERVTSPIVDSNLSALLHERMISNAPCPHTKEELKKDPLAVWVELRLSLTQDSDSSPYKRAKPQKLSDIYSLLAEQAGCSEVQAKAKLNELLEVASATESEAFFAFKLHQFISGPSCLMTTLQPKGERIITVNEQLYTKDKDGTNIRLFKTYFCRDCGQEFIPVYLSDGVYTPRTLGEKPEETNEETPEWGFLVPYADDFDYDSDDITTLPASWRQLKRDQEEIVKDKQKYVPMLRYVNKNGIEEDGATPYFFIPDTVRFCPSCGIEMDDRAKEKNKLAGLSGEGRSSATTIITINLLNQMFEDENSKKKILGFVDNRQDAALQSGNFNDFINKAIVRGSCIAAMNTMQEPCSVQDLCQRIFDVLGFSDTSNKEALSELYVKPDAPDPVRKRNEQVALNVLRYRILDETKQAWKYSNPSVFHLGLLKIRYRDFGAMMEDSNQINKYEILSTLSVPARKRIMLTLLDEMVGQHCLSDEMLDVLNSEKIKKEASNFLNPRWSFDAEESLYEGNRLTFEKTGQQHLKGAYHYLACTSNSKMGRLLKKDSFWSQDSQYNSKNKKELGFIVTKLASELISLASYYGIVDERTEAGKKYYQVYSTALLIEKGDGIPKNKKWKNEYFQVLYKTIGRQFVARSNGIFSYVSAEHTAQVSSEERETLEKRFKGEEGFAPLPVLYCSPTMELGIDISSLNTVYMRNVPPTPANYAQRSGRAGRSGQAALVVTYCSSQSPHDQWYFKHSNDMVSGAVVTPSLDLSNKDLVDSHLMAVWFAAAKCKVDSSISEIIETENETYQIKDEIRQVLTRPELKDEAYEGIKDLTNSISEYLTKERAPWYCDGYEQIFVENAYDKFSNSFTSWINLVKDTKKQMDDAHKQLSRGLPKNSKDIISKIHNDAANQLTLLTHPPKNANSASSDFYIFRYLAGQGVMPGYNFPRLPVIAWIPKTKQAHEDNDEKIVSISRSRFLALSEFGPQSIIYHRGNSFKVYKVKLNASSSVENQNGQLALATKSVIVCQACGFGLISNSDGIVTEDRCPNCDAILDRTNTIPSLYRIETVETRPVSAITSNDEERMRRGYDLQTFYSFDKADTLETTREVLNQDNNVIATLRYIPNATIYKVNKGWKNRKNKSEFGFLISPSTGIWKRVQSDEVDDNENEEIENKVQDFRQRIVPYVEDRKNCLILQLHCAGMDDDRVIPTLQSAFSRSISNVFQIEGSELSVELLTDNSSSKSILFYESSEGGAGVLSRIVSSEEVYLKTICKQALEIMHYSFNHDKEILTIEDLHDDEPNCVSGCYNCLLSYYNQPYHAQIDRRNKNVLAILVSMANGSITQPKEHAANSQFGLFLRVKGIVLTDLVQDKTVLSNEYTISYYSNSCKTAFFTTSPDQALVEYLKQRGVQVIIIGSTKEEWEENLQNIKNAIEGGLN